MKLALLYLLATFGGFLLIDGRNYPFDEAGSIALIEEIDKYSRLYDDGHGHDGDDEEDFEMTDVPRYTNEWVVEITGGYQAAEALAEEMGYEIIGEVGGITSKTVAQ